MALLKLDHNNKIMDGINPSYDWVTENYAEFIVSKIKFRVSFSYWSKAINLGWGTDPRYYDRINLAKARSSTGKLGIFPQVDAQVRTILIDYLLTRRPDAVQILGNEPKRIAWYRNSYGALAIRGYHTMVVSDGAVFHKPNHQVQPW